VPPSFPGQAHVLADASRDLGLEGIIKRFTSSYRPGSRSSDWLKIRYLAAADLLIGGWLPRAGCRSQLAGSVLAGVPGPAGLEYLGSVRSGFAEAEVRDLTVRLLALEQPEPPFAARCRPTSPDEPRGPGQPWRPRSPTSSSLQPGGCATPSGAAYAQPENVDNRPLEIAVPVSNRLHVPASWNVAHGRLPAAGVARRREPARQR
jgi:hypothetical protein